MSSKRLRFRTESQIFSIPKDRFWIGLIIGILYAIIIYAFLFVGREVIRLGFILPGYYDVWILTDIEVHFYNLYFAFVSVFFGQAACFNYWINYPKKFLEKNNYHYRKTSVLGDLFGLSNVHFLYFTKLGALYGIFFGGTLGFYVFSLFSFIKYILIFIIIVLFFEQWKTLRLIYPRKSLKWMGVSMVTLILLSFGLSRINIIDYKMINEGYLKSRVDYNYKLNIPYSNFTREVIRKYLTEDLYFVYPKNQVDTAKFPAIIFRHKKIELTDLDSIITSFNSEYSDVVTSQLSMVLHIDKDIPYKYVKKLKDEISKSKINRTLFRTTNKKIQNIPSYIQPAGIPLMLHNQDSVNISPNGLFENSYIKIYPDKLTFNNNQVPFNNLNRLIINKIKESRNYIFYLDINKNCNYNDYIQLLDHIFVSLNTVRDSIALRKHNKLFNDLNYNEMAAIRELYPLAIWEQ